MLIACSIFSLQIFIHEPVMAETKMQATSLAMVFTPSLFRTQMGGSISKVFSNARIEQRFVLLLLEKLDVTLLHDEDDWVPVHGRFHSVSSSIYSAQSGRNDDASSTTTHSSHTASQNTYSSRPSVDSVDSSTSSTSTFSCSHSRRTNRHAARLARAIEQTRRTQVVEKDEQISGSGSSSEGNTSGADLEQMSPDTSRGDFTPDITSNLSGQADKPLDTTPREVFLPPSPRFIKPLIVIQEAD